MQSSLEDENRLSAYLESMLEGLSSGIVAVDTANRVTLINEAAASLLECRPESILHEPAETVLGDAASLLHLTITAGEGVSEQDRELTATEGHSRPVRFKTACLRSRDGTVLGALAIIDDVSQMRELSRQASRVSTLTALGEMSATVAHEIRNPLGGIGGFADVLARKLEPDDPRRRLVVKITEGIDRLNSVVSNLLTYTRPAQLNLRPVEVVEDCVGFFEIDVQRDYTVEKLPCQIDPEQVQQIVLNLLHNAVQAIPESGWVRIQVRSEDDAAGLYEWEETATPSSPVAVLSIADSGIGMTKDIQAKLFRPFFTTKEDGNGLGLATAKKIIEAHGGAIDVQSKPRKGTEFSVILPVG